MSNELMLLVVFLLTSGLLVGLGIPLAMGLVPPNRLYGFRTRTTLASDEAWYPANRVTGYWIMATGIGAAAASIAAYLASLAPPAAALTTLAPVLIGVSGMLIHAGIVAERTKAPTIARQ